MWVHPDRAHRLTRSTRALGCTACILVLVWYSVGVSFAQQSRKETTECQPVYGHYWRSYKWGWYGAPREVKTPVEAKEIIERLIVQDRGIRVIRMHDRPHFYVAEIINNRGVIVDLILIDKRTGRVRSMF